jgi:hypothetical protein
MVLNFRPVGHDLPLSYQSRREKQGGVLPPPPSVLVPGSALGSCRHGALSSARAVIHRRAAQRLGQRSTGDHTAGRLASRATFLRSRASSNLRSRSAKIAGSRPASLAAGVT